MTAQNRSRLTMLAGWLFADLFLVLLIAGLAALPAKPGDQPPAPPPSPAQHRQGLDPDRKEFSIALSPKSFRAGERDRLVELVENELRRQNPGNRRVGFVLVFASDDKNNADRATATATDAYELLKSRLPIFGESSGLGYWNGNHNNFELKVFLLY